MKIKTHYTIKALSILLFVFGFYSAIQAQEQPVKPKLFIGGGALTEELYQEFANLAGPEIKLVVIPTASSRKPDIKELIALWQSRGIKDVTVLHTRDRAIAMSPDFSDPIKEADAIWFNGGSQSRIADAYLNTPVEEEIYNLSERGGIIGGSSAGAAIMSKVMISGGKTEPKITTGFDLLPGVIMDQHFLKRNRLARLMAAVKTHPDLIGYGIDEATAILVYEDSYKIIGESYVLRIQHSEDEILIDAFEGGDIIILEQ